MKLSGAYILRQLQRQTEIVKWGGISGNDGYLRPFLMDRGRKMPSGHVMIATKREAVGGRNPLIRKRPDTLLILTGWDKADEENIVIDHEPYICVASGDHPVEILNYLQDVYDRCDEWKEELNGYLMGKGTIQELLNISREMFDNPLLVTGTDFELIGQVGEEELPVSRRLYTDNKVNLRYMNAFIQDQAFKERQESRGCEILPAFTQGWRTLNRNLWVNGKVTHRLIMPEAPEKLDEGAFCLFEELAKYLEYMLMHAPAMVEMDGLDDIFRTVITERTADYMMMSRRLNALGWKDKHEYLCLVLQTTYLLQEEMTANAISQYIRNQFPGSCSFQMDEEIITFFDLSKMEMDEEEVEQKLTFFIRDSFLKAGYSRTLEGHMNLRRQYIQAKTALEVGNRKRPYQWIHRFNQVALTYILEQATRKLPASMLSHENLLELKKADEEHHSELYETLKVYLEQNLNATQTAAELYIHRSTLLYRLEKIRSILQSTMEDPDEIFYLNLSVRMLELEEEKG